MKCRNCKYCYTNDTMGSLYICVNGKADNFSQFTGLMCEDDCEFGESEFDMEENMNKDFFEIMKDFNIENQNLAFYLEKYTDEFAKHGFEIKLRNREGLDSYIINISKASLDLINEHFSKYGFELHHNNTTTIFWKVFS